MTHREPAAAVNDWYQPLRRSGLLTLSRQAPNSREHAYIRLVDSLRWLAAPILSHAVSNGRAAAIAAFYAVLKDLLKHR